MQDELKITLSLPKPHPAQQTVIDSNARFKVLCTGRRFGKSLVAKILSIQDMLNGKSVAYVTPTFNLAKEFYSDFHKTLPQQLVKNSNQTDLLIQLHGGGTLKFFSGEAIDNFRGRKFHKVIIDEAAFIPDLEKAWNESIRPTLTDYKGDALFISTPKGRNFFDALFIKGKHKEYGYESFHYTSYDNPYIDPEEIDAAKLSLPDEVFNQEYLALPGEDAGNPFGIDNIKKNVVSEDKFSKRPTVVYGIDVASLYDYTVIIGLDDEKNITYFDRFQLPWEVTKIRIAELPERPLKVIDSTGVGTPLLESLELTVNNIEGFVFTGQSKPQIMRKLMIAVAESSITYNQMTADEMAVFTYKHTDSGHTKYQAASGYNDDCVCALAIANHYADFFKKVTNWKLYTAN